MRFGITTPHTSVFNRNLNIGGLSWTKSRNKSTVRKRKYRKIGPRNCSTDIADISDVSDTSGIEDIANTADFSDSQDNHADGWIDIDSTSASNEDFFQTHIYRPSGSWQQENPQGQYGPHFPTYTSAAFSVFFAAFHLSRQTYNALVRIIRHPNFLASDVPSYSQIKRLHRGVRTITTHIRQLPIRTATSKKFTPTYTHSVIDIIRRAMESRILRSQMFFGAGQRVENSREFYHGDLWKESPLFGIDSVFNSAGMSELQAS